MSRFEKFAAERDVIERIEQLRADGFRDDEITVISNRKLEYAYLKYRDVNFKAAEGNTWDKFVSMFSNDDPKDRVLGEFDITDSERAHFKDALDRDEILLLKAGYGVPEEGYVRNETREHHETQQQDAQGLETEAAREERMEIQKEMRRRYMDASYDYPKSAGRTVEQDDHITLKDTTDGKEYGYPSNVEASEYGYTKRPGKEYGYKQK